jgi:hypothetical protein
MQRISGLLGAESHPLTRWLGVRSNP